MDRPSLPLLSLVVANGVTIALALLQDWELGAVLAVYWFQSVTIGLFTFVGLLLAPTHGVAGARIRSVFLAGFFAVHYGLFHLGYLVFLAGFVSGGLFSFGDPLGITIGCAIFFVNHLVSFLWYRPFEEFSPEVIFREPYARIFPMHLTIILGAFVTGMIPGGLGTRLVPLLFLVLKAGADIGGHLKKHGQDGRLSAPFPGPPGG